VDVARFALYVIQLHQVVLDIDWGLLKVLPLRLYLSQRLLHRPSVADIYRCLCQHKPLFRLWLGSFLSHGAKGGVEAGLTQLRRVNRGEPLVFVPAFSLASLCSISRRRSKLVQRTGVSHTLGHLLSDALCSWMAWVSAGHGYREKVLRVDLIGRLMLSFVASRTLSEERLTGFPVVPFSRLAPFCRHQEVLIKVV